MRKIRNMTIMTMVMLMIFGLILCLFGIDVPKSIMSMEFVVMIVSYGVN